MVVSIRFVQELQVLLLQQSYRGHSLSPKTINTLCKTSFKGQHRFFLLTHRSVVEDLYWLPVLVTSLLEFGDPKVCGLSRACSDAGRNVKTELSNWSGWPSYEIIPVALVCKTLMTMSKKRGHWERYWFLVVIMRTVCACAVRLSHSWYY